MCCSESDCWNEANTPAFAVQWNFYTTWGDSAVETREHSFDPSDSTHNRRIMHKIHSLSVSCPQRESNDLSLILLGEPSLTVRFLNDATTTCIVTTMNSFAIVTFLDAEKN